MAGGSSAGAGLHPHGSGNPVPAARLLLDGVLTRNTADTNVYLSMIEQGRQGSILLRNLCTTEPHPPFQLRPVYAFLGLLGRAFPPLSVVAVYEIGRLLFSALTLAVAWFLISKIFETNSDRRGFARLRGTGPAVDPVLRLDRWLPWTS